MQALSQLSKPQETAAPPSQPLLIELQGDRYVRLNEGGLAEKANPGEPNRVASTKTASRTASVPSLPAVTLIFLDGHHEDVQDYTVAAGVMYVRGDIYRDGYWNKRIELTTLNLPETFRTNESRGVHFVLPGAPNEIVTRP